MTIEITDADIAQLAHLRQQADVADNKGRGWDADDVAAKQKAFCDFCRTLGISVLSGEAIAWERTAGEIEAKQSASAILGDMFRDISTHGGF